jgi:hypothetical protein
VPGKALEPGLLEACLAGLADGFSSAFVLVVGGDVADACVQPVLLGSGAFWGPAVSCLCRSGA